MKVHVIGDVHGKIDRYMHLVKYLAKDEPSIQLGDMAYGFPKVILPELEGNRHWFRGNHDHPQRAQAHPNYAGDFGLLYGIFFMGGAYSIDSKWRVLGRDWWPDEELSQTELQAAIDLYREIKPDVVITHDAPTVVADYILNQLSMGMPGGPDFSPSRTNIALQEMFETHQPKKWLFGHYHFNRTFKIRETDFTVIGELGVAHIEV